MRVAASCVDTEDVLGGCAERVNMGLEADAGLEVNIGLRAGVYGVVELVAYFAGCVADGELAGPLLDSDADFVAASCDVA